MLLMSILEALDIQNTTLPFSVTWTLRGRVVNHSRQFRGQNTRYTQITSKQHGLQQREGLKNESNREQIYKILIR